MTLLERNVQASKWVKSLFIGSCIGLKKKSGGKFTSVEFDIDPMGVSFNV